MSFVAPPCRRRRAVRRMRRCLLCQVAVKRDIAACCLPHATGPSERATTAILSVQRPLLSPCVADANVTCSDGAAPPRRYYHYYSIPRLQVHPALWAERASRGERGWPILGNREIERGHEQAELRWAESIPCSNSEPVVSAVCSGLLV